MFSFSAFSSFSFLYFYVFLFDIFLFYVFLSYYFFGVFLFDLFHQPHIKQGGKADPGAMRIHIKQGGKSRSRSHEEPKFHSISLKSLATRFKQSQVTSVSTRIQIKLMRIHGDPQGSKGIHGDPQGSMRSRGSVFFPLGFLNCFSYSFVVNREKRI